MSQLADLEDVVVCTNLTADEKAKLFLDLLSALDWEVDGVQTVEDAKIHLNGGQ
jgi:hypothetical protein